VPITTRFAPSPTGYLHLGHAFAAIVAWRRAREAGGRFLLRIEDIDPGRSRREFAEHFPEYRAALDRLSAAGLLYPCFCTRAEIAREVLRSASAPHGPDGAPLYPGTCRHLSAAEREARIAAAQPFALRLDTTRAIAAAGTPLQYAEEHDGRIICDPARFGDVVLARRDAPASYHLCVTHDDALQGVTLVTRGADLRDATDIHRLLQALMGWPAPTYAHHALRLDAAGRRLAKRDRAVTLRDLRARGIGAGDVRALAMASP
jgi:glutamyl-Q tRNA(Asp) synthetase